MARKAQGNARPPRPAITLYPAPLITLGALVGGLLVLGLAYSQYPRDGWYALVWVVPGLCVLAQPITGFVRGQANTLRIGLRTIDLTGLTKVTVHERSQDQAVRQAWHRRPSWSGRGGRRISFLTTRGFTRLVEWLGVLITTIEGRWSMRSFRRAHPALIPTRSLPRNKDAAKK